MRLPLTPTLSTKDAVSNKNARLTNCLKEAKLSPDKKKELSSKAVVRPGLVLDAQASGAGNGLVAFNGDLVSVYGATLGFGIAPGGEQEVYTPVGFDDSAYGIAGGGLILKSAAGIPLIQTSSDGINYTTVNTTDEIVGVFYAYSKFYGFDSATQTELYKTTDGGVTWTLAYDFSPYAINVGILAEILPSSVNLFSTHLGNDYKFTSSGLDTVWSGPSVVSVIPNGFPMVYFPAAAKSYYVTLGSPVYLYYTNDSFATAPTSTGFLVFWSNSGNFPNLAVLGGKMYALMSDEFDQTITLYSTTDGVTWDSGILINDDGIDSQNPKFSMYVLGTSLVIYYSSDLTAQTVMILTTDGTIPALATITGTHFDFAQSPL